MSKLVYLDTETTDLKPGQIGQLSLIIEDNGNIRAKNYFMKVKSMAEGAAKVTHRDVAFYEKVSEGKEFKDYADEIFDELKDATIIAHNEKFDENFISTEFWRLDKIFKPSGTFCTMEFFKPIMQMPNKYRKYKSPYKNPKLEELVDWLKIDPDKVQKYTQQLFNMSENTLYHDAMYDTTSMFIAVHVYKEKNEGNVGDWHKAFVKGA